MGLVGSSDLCLWKKASASSEKILQDEEGNVQEENYASTVIDGMPTTRWRPAKGDTNPWWSVDLGEEQLVDSIVILWDCDAEDVNFHLEFRGEGGEWMPIHESPLNQDAHSSYVNLKREARLLRLKLAASYTESIGLVRFEAYGQSSASLDRDPQAIYYEVVDKYRIRWPDVIYQPGELVAKAYSNGIQIGETVAVTSSAPARLKLTADRPIIQSDGMDLCYVTIEMVDEYGRLCPLAMHELTFELEGELVWMAVGNGNPMAHRSFTDKSHPLFYGKAVAVLKSTRRSGKGVLKVRTEGLPITEIHLESVQ